MSMLCFDYHLMSMPCFIANSIKWPINLYDLAPIYLSDFIPYHPPPCSLSSRQHDIGSNLWIKQALFYPKTFALAIPSALTILFSKSSQAGSFSSLRCWLKYHHLGKAFPDHSIWSSILPQALSSPFIFLIVCIAMWSYLFVYMFFICLLPLESKLQ